MGLRRRGGHRVPSVEWAQRWAEHSPSPGPVREAAAGRGDGSILSTRASPWLHAWVSRDSRPLGRADTLAGREGSGTAAHFLGRDRNS